MIGEDNHNINYEVDLKDYKVKSKRIFVSPSFVNSHSSNKPSTRIFYGHPFTFSLRPSFISDMMYTNPSVKDVIRWHHL